MKDTATLEAAVDAISPEAQRAIRALAAFRLDAEDEWPKPKLCTDMAKLAGARPEVVCAAYGYLRSARDRRRHVWVHATTSAATAVLPEDDPEVVAAFAVHRAVADHRGPLALINHLAAGPCSRVADRGLQGARGRLS